LNAGLGNVKWIHDSGTETSTQGASEGMTERGQLLLLGWF